MNKWIQCSTSLALIAPLFILGCSHKPTAQVADSVVSGLSVAQVQLLQVPVESSAVGTVHAKESAALSAQVTGRVVAVLVHEGDHVRAGQALIRLDDAAARAELDRAQATVAANEHQVDAARTQSELAASTLARYKMLRDSKSVSPQEFDEADRRAQSAAAQLEAARAQLAAAKAGTAGARTTAGYSVIAAPFTGIVTARHVDPGAMAIPGTPLLEVDRSGVLQLHVTVDESLLRSIRTGVAIDASIPTVSSTAIQGHVAEIVPAADPASHSFEVKIDLPSSSALRTGMYGTASLAGNARAALLIPQSAVAAHGSLNTVWTLDSNHIASIRYITLGAKHEHNVEVLSGLSKDEIVVLQPGDRELAGSRIEVRP